MSVVEALEDYHLPGSYAGIPKNRQWEDNITESVSPMALVSSVLFPGPADSLLVKRSSINDDRGLPGAWVKKEPDFHDNHPAHAKDVTVHASEPANKNEVVDSPPSDTLKELRQTIVSLRKETQALEDTNIILQKSIQIVAKKRVRAQNKRRKQSQWVWCEGPTETGTAESETDASETDGEEDADEIWQDSTGEPTPSGSVSIQGKHKQNPLNRLADTEWFVDQDASIIASLTHPNPSNFPDLIRDGFSDWEWVDAH
ncbi:uncharacterized protein BYT42DRAFT_615060 [Radiomyces spectabilis]|uniref:uncharacterized protein n=1 Tax=Radiomyces spectabilis TaxID=64574 RepID=UPI0022211C82|nr:uncharacterized protein BYT42DRAFT_615060 [Radiomyces spectabilis]KAI8376294.1 hypothetical protein BYT42DRAFT_615060 [Radiomyces spectabilis]